MKDVIIMRLVRPKPSVTFYDVHLVLSSDWRKRFWQTVVVYGHSSNNICGGGARWSYQKSRDRKSPWPELMSVTWPEEHLTGSLFCACPAFSPRFFSYENSSTSTTATGSDQRSREPFEVPLGVRNRKLCNIRPSGAFWPEVTLWNVTP